MGAEPFQAMFWEATTAATRLTMMTCLICMLVICDYGKQGNVSRILATFYVNWRHFLLQYQREQLLLTVGDGREAFERKGRIELRLKGEEGGGLLYAMLS
jgi:hypothetical protein